METESKSPHTQSPTAFTLRAQGEHKNHPHTQSEGMKKYKEEERPTHYNRHTSDTQRHKERNKERHRERSIHTHTLKKGERQCKATDLSPLRRLSSLLLSAQVFLITAFYEEKIEAWRVGAMGYTEKDTET